MQRFFGGGDVREEGGKGGGSGEDGRYGSEDGRHGGKTGRGRGGDGRAWYRDAARHVATNAGDPAKGIRGRAGNFRPAPTA